MAVHIHACGESGSENPRADQELQVDVGVEGHTPRVVREFTSGDDAVDDDDVAARPDAKVSRDMRLARKLLYQFFNTHPAGILKAPSISNGSGGGGGTAQGGKKKNAGSLLRGGGGRGGGGGGGGGGGLSRSKKNDVLVKHCSFSEDADQVATFSIDDERRRPGPSRPWAIASSNTTTTTTSSSSSDSSSEEEQEEAAESGVGEGVPPQSRRGLL